MSTTPRLRQTIARERLASWQRGEAVATSEDRWLNVDGLHGTPFYCHGRPRPLLRGWLHLLPALASPIWSGYLISLCPTTETAAAAALACFGATAMLGASGCYHRFPWRSEVAETFAGNLDLCGIYLQIAFAGSPLYVTLLPPPVAWLVVQIMAGCAAAGCLLVFSPVELGLHAAPPRTALIEDGFPTWKSRASLGRHLRTAVYCAMGLVQLVPVTTSTLWCAASRSTSRPPSPPAPLPFTARPAPSLPRRYRSVYSQFTPLEQGLGVVGATSYLVGSQCYATASPRLWPPVFSFHELWHLCVLVGVAAHYALCCSVLLRHPDAL